MALIRWAAIAGLLWPSAIAATVVASSLEAASLDDEFCIELLNGNHPPEVMAEVSVLEERFCTLSLLNNNRPMPDPNAEEGISPSATADQPSDLELTRPSLWWQQQQQGEAINQRLIDTWQAYNDTVSSVEDTVVGPVDHVDVFVNGQIWPLLTYLEQYEFITKFGTSAQAYGYHLRVFMGSRRVGLYVCGKSNPMVTSEGGDGVALACRVDLDYFGQGAIRGGGRR